MKILKRTAAVLLACMAMLFMLTACSEADVNKLISSAQNVVKGIAVEAYNGAVAWVSEQSSSVDAAFKGELDNLNAYGNSNEEAFRQKVLELVNAERTKRGLKALTMTNSKLTQAAQNRAVEIASKYFPAHKRPNGSSCFTILPEVGLVSGTDYNYCGENIASGWISPETVMIAWMNSAGHRANILNENYTQIGIGYYFEAGSASGSYCYWTQMFLG